MDINAIEEAKKLLEEDLANFPYILSNPMGQGTTRRKILNYLYACILSKLPKADCVDWLYELYNEQNNKEKCTFQSLIDSVAGALYDFYNYLDTTK